MATALGSPHARGAYAESPTGQPESRMTTMKTTKKMTLLLSSILAVPLVLPKQTHEAAALAGDAARVSPPPLRHEVLVAIHAAGFEKEGHLAAAQTSAQ